MVAPNLGLKLIPKLIGSAVTNLQEVNSILCLGQSDLLALLEYFHLDGLVACPLGPCVSKEPDPSIHVLG